MSNTRQVMQQALRALEKAQVRADMYAVDNAIDALRAALDEPDPEPVMWIWPHQLEDLPIYHRKHIVAFAHKSKYHDNEKSSRIPLYAAPPTPNSNFAQVAEAIGQELNRVLKRNHQLEKLHIELTKALENIWDDASTHCGQIQMNIADMADAALTKVEESK